MSKKLAKWYLAVIILILIVLTCPPFIYYKNIIYFVYIYALLEGVILDSVLRILRKSNMLFSWKVITYYIVVVAFSISASYLLYLFIHTRHYHFLGINRLDYYILSVFILFVFLNVVLSKIIFAIGILKACLLGLIMGFINTFLIII